MKHFNLHRGKLRVISRRSLLSDTTETYKALEDHLGESYHLYYRLPDFIGGYYNILRSDTEKVVGVSKDLKYVEKLVHNSLALQGAKAGELVRPKLKVRK